MSPPDRSNKRPRRPFLNPHFKRWRFQIYVSEGNECFIEASNETLNCPPFSTRLLQKANQKVLERVWKQIPF